MRKSKKRSKRSRKSSSSSASRRRKGARKRAGTGAVKKLERQLKRLTAKVKKAVRGR